MTAPDINSQKIAKLEQQIQQLLMQNRVLSSRIEYVERENSRRKSELTQVISRINKKG